MRILIADSHREFRDRVGQLLRARLGYEVCGEAGDGQELVGLSRQLLPDLIIAECLLPIIDAIEAVELIRQFHPSVQTLLVSYDENEDLITRCRRAGANGFVPKLEVAELLLNAVDAISRGNTFFPRDLGR